MMSTLNEFIINFNWQNFTTHFLASVLIYGTLFSLIIFISMKFINKISPENRHHIWFFSLIALWGIPVFSFVLPSWNQYGQQATIISNTELQKTPASMMSSNNETLSNKNRAQLTETSQNGNSSHSKITPSSVRNQVANVAIPPATQPMDKRFSFSINSDLTYYYSFAAFIWFAVSFILVLRIALRLIRLHFYYKSSQQIYNQSILETARKSKRKFGMNPSIIMIENEQCKTPMTWGYFQPKVLLPINAAEWDKNHLTTILNHEFAHIKRKDYLTYLIGQFTCAVFWFNIFSWKIVKEMRFEQERSADNWVIDRGTKSTDYAELLLQYVWKNSSSNLQSTAALGVSHTNQLNKRVNSILDQSQNRKRSSKKALAFCLLSVFLTSVTIATAGLVIIKDKNGKEIVRIEVPDDSSITVIKNSKPKRSALVTQGVLPGLVPNPDISIADGKRWQIIPKSIRGNIWAVNWSPDGKQVAIAESNRIRIANPSDLSTILYLLGHQGQITSISWSPDNKMIASSSADSSIRIWSHDGIPLKVLKGHQGSVSDISWSPDSKMIASSGFDGTLKIWNINGDIIRNINGKESSLTSVAWSPDGKQIATGDHDFNVRLWSPEGVEIHTFQGHSYEITSVCWNPNSKQLASSSAEGKLAIWNIDGSAGPTMSEHRNEIHSVKWSPDGTKIVSVGWDGQARIWNPDGQLLSTPGYSYNMYTVAWSPDSKSIITGCQQLASNFKSSVNIFNIENNDLESLPRRLTHEGNSIYSVVWSPDGNRIVSGCLDKSARLWDSNGNLLKKLIGHEFDVWVVEWAPDGKKFATSTRKDGLILIWDKDGNLLKKINHNRGCMSIKWHPESKLIAAVGDDKIVRVWDIEDVGTPVRSLGGHTHGITSVDWSPDGQYLISGSYDQTVRFWDKADNAKILRDFSTGFSGTRAVAWHPSGTFFLSGREDGSIRFWSADGTPKFLLNAHQKPVQSLRWNKKGSRFASASWDNSVRIWDINGKIIRNYLEHTGEVYSADWNHVNDKIVSGGIDGVIRVWSPETGQTEWVAVTSEKEGTVTLSQTGEIIDGNEILLAKEYLFIYEKENGQTQFVPMANYKSLFKK